jgi:hypothetical protein
VAESPCRRESEKLKRPSQRKKPDKPPGKPDGPPGQQPPQSETHNLTAQSHHCGSPSIQTPAFSVVETPAVPSAITARSLTVGPPYFTTPDFQIDAIPPEIPPAELIELIALPLNCASAMLKPSKFAVFGGPVDVEAAALVTPPPYYSIPDFEASRSRTWFGSRRQ